MVRADTDMCLELTAIYGGTYTYVNKDGMSVYPELR